MAEDGTVVTFYSYKGGVGRTFALANVATLLALWGYRVLCVDWDLEAPGLALYFKKWMDAAPHPGVVDLLLDRRRKRTDLAAFITKVHIPAAELNASNPYPRSDVKIDLITAGKDDGNYVSRLQSIDWQKGYREDGLGENLEDLRNDWKARYDFILIDSRTGITDTGGICAVQLPDLLVVALTPNQQSIDGTLEIARRVAASRNRMPLERSKLLILPLPSRFDKRAESSIAQEWLNIFAAQLAPLYDDWRPRQIGVPELLSFIRVPYVANWSFGEKLPVIEENIRDSENIGYSLETLASVIALKFGQNELLISNRDSYVSAAQAGALQSLGLAERFKYDVFLSCSSDDDSLAKDLAKGLTNRGLKVWIQAAELTMGESWASSLDQALAAAEHLVVIERGELSSYQQHEITSFLRSAASETTTVRRLIPVLASSVPAASGGHARMSAGVPSLLRQFTSIRQGNRSTAEVAALVAQAVRAPKASASDDPQKGRFGESPARNGRRLTARVAEVADGEGWYRVRLRVQSTAPAKPLAGDVTFFLHPTFRPSEIKKPVRRGECVLVLRAYGAFTVGVEADEGDTCLELDLANLPDAPQEFRES